MGVEPPDGPSCLALIGAGQPSGWILDAHEAEDQYVDPVQHVPDIPSEITRQEFDEQAQGVYEQILMLVVASPRQLRGEVARLEGEINELRGMAMELSRFDDYVEAGEAIDRLRQALRFNARLSRANHLSKPRRGRRA